MHSRTKNMKIILRRIKTGCNEIKCPFCHLLVEALIISHCHAGRNGSKTAVFHFTPFDSSSCIFKPIYNVVDIQLLATPSRFEWVQFSNIFFHLYYEKHKKVIRQNFPMYLRLRFFCCAKKLLYLLSGGMVVFCKPFLKSRNFRLWIKTYSHSWSCDLKMIGM